MKPRHLSHLQFHVPRKHLLHLKRKHQATWHVSLVKKSSGLPSLEVYVKSLMHWQKKETNKHIQLYSKKKRSNIDIPKNGHIFPAGVHLFQGNHHFGENTMVKPTGFVLQPR